MHSRADFRALLDLFLLKPVLSEISAVNVFCVVLIA